VVYFVSFISKELDALGFSGVGYVLGARSILYLVACLLLPYTCEHSSRKAMFLIAFLGFGGLSVLFGPS